MQATHLAIARAEWAKKVAPGMVRGSLTVGYQGRPGEDEVHTECCPGISTEHNTLNAGDSQGALCG